MNKSFQSKHSTLTLDDIQSKIEEFKSLKQESQKGLLTDLNKSRDLFDSKAISPLLTFSYFKQQQQEHTYKHSIKKNKRLSNDGLVFNVLQSKPIAIKTKGASNKQYLQWNEKLRGGESTSSNNYGITSKRNNNKNNQAQSSLNANQNRIKTQINLFVKQLNYQDNTIYDKRTNVSYNKNNNLQRNQPNVISTSAIYNNPFNKSKRSIPDSIQISESSKGKRPNHKPQYKTMNEILKYSEIKAIKSSIYAMTEEDINSIPPEYLDELKDLSNLINSLM